MSNEYKMTLSLSVLNHLGVNLYSNIPAVMSEVVANAWDADAKNVKINIDFASRKIVVIDDGCGMSFDDINSKFLLVGYNRREDSPGQTPAGRIPMGRKGIGKLSLFSIADKIEVHSKKGEETNAFLLDSKAIKEELDSSGSEYHPDKIEYAFPDFSGESGTRLVIRDLKKTMTESTARFLRQRLARRFALYDMDFRVLVDGEEISIDDRNYFGKLEYLFQFGKDYSEHCAENVEKESRGFQFDKDGKPSPNGEYAVSGWIGLVRSSSDLTRDDNLNKVTIFARKKLAQENVLDDFGFGGFFTRYVVGEINADFLDKDGEEDIATSSRQGIMEDSPRFKALYAFLKGELSHVGNARDKYKAASAVSDACKLIPEIKEWLGSLSSPLQKAAEKLLMQINKIQTDESHRAQLFVYGIQAFHSLRARDLLHSFESIDPQELPAFLKAVAEFDDLEEAHYHEIIRGRLLVIAKMGKDINANQYEEVLQKYLANHLWLLDPSWDRATSQPSVEQRVSQIFEGLSGNLSAAERNGRIDILYRKTAGTHVIIELKRPNVSLKKGELSDQVGKYRRALKKCLRAAGEINPHIEVVCILGKELQGWEDKEDRNREMEALASEDIKVLQYLEMLSNAERMYQEYLDAKAKVSEIQTLLSKIRDRISASDNV